MSTLQFEFGRVDETGNFYVIDAGSERLLGSQPAMSLEDALAFYVRKYNDLESNVRLLEQRVKAKADAKSIKKSADKLTVDLTEPVAIGDLASLRERVAAVLSGLGDLLAEASAKQAELAVEALAAREAIAVEAEALAAKDPQKVNYKTGSAKML